MDEFVQHLDRISREYRGDAEAALEKGAKHLLKEIKNASPVGKAVHPHKLKESWKCKIRGYRVEDLRAEIRSTAPHFHLIDRGFQRVSPQGRMIPNSPRDNQNLHFLQKALDASWPDAKDKMLAAFYEKVRGHLG